MPIINPLPKPVTACLYGVLSVLLSQIPMTTVSLLPYVRKLQSDTLPEKRSVKLVLKTLRKMHKSEFWMNFYTDGRNTNLELSSTTGITAIEDPEITGEIYYRVKAGVCYIKCNITTQSTSVRNGAILCNGLPKTAVGQSRYCSNGPGTIGIGVIYIDNNTTALKINLSGQAGNGYTSFSYPVNQ